MFVVLVFTTGSGIHVPCACLEMCVYSCSCGGNATVCKECTWETVCKERTCTCYLCLSDNLLLGLFLVLLRVSLYMYKESICLERRALQVRVPPEAALLFLWKKGVVFGCRCLHLPCLYS